MVCYLKSISSIILIFLFSNFVCWRQKWSQKFTIRLVNNHSSNSKNHSSKGYKFSLKKITFRIVNNHSSNSKNHLSKGKNSHWSKVYFSNELNSSSNITGVHYIGEIIFRKMMSIWQHMYVLRTKWAKCFRKSQNKFDIDHTTTSHTEAMNRSMKHGSQALASMNLDRSADKLVKHSNNALDRKERWVWFNFRKISITPFTTNMGCSYAVQMQNSWAPQFCGPGVKQKIILLHIARDCPHTQWI